MRSRVVVELFQFHCGEMQVTLKTGSPRSRSRWTICHVLALKSTGSPRVRVRVLCIPSADADQYQLVPAAQV